MDRERRGTERERERAGGGGTEVREEEEGCVDSCTAVFSKSIWPFASPPPPPSYTGQACSG